MFDKIVEDAEKFAADLRAARDAAGPGGKKIIVEELLGLAGDGAKLVVDVASLVALVKK